VSAASEAATWAAHNMTELPSTQVIIIDDDDAVLDSFRFMLQHAGVRVATYLSATDYLESGRLQPCGLIVDQHMPCITGLELAERLRADGIETPILLVTALISPSIIARAAELGVDRVLQKPPAEEDIMRFVASCTKLAPRAPQSR
jgi:FixJ family two-component response regulator